MKRANKLPPEDDPAIAHRLVQSDLSRMLTIVRELVPDDAPPAKHADALDQSIRMIRKHSRCSMRSALIPT
jgi:hypothetical protein